MPLILILMALASSGCAGITRPDTNLCVANVPGLSQKCHNLKSDYDNNGMLDPNAKGEIRQYATPLDMLNALNKSTNTDPDGVANLKAFIKDLRSVCH